MPPPYIKPPRTMLELYRGLPEGTLVQLVNNQLYLYPSHTDAHQSVLGKILSPLAGYVEDSDAGQLLMGPFDVYLDDQNAFQPDIIFALPENRYRFRQDGFYGTPDLVIEVLEPFTQQLDEGSKKDIYKRSGVKEYWMINSLNKNTEGFWLTDGEYGLLPSETGRIAFRLVDFSIVF